MRDLDKSADLPVLPEHYKADTINGMLPGDLVFPYHHCLSFDKSTGLVFIDPTRKLEENDLNPSKSDYKNTSRIALSRIYKPTESGVLDGFIVDLRHLPVGALNSNFYTHTEDESVEDHTFVENNRRNHIPVLGAVFRDMDGDPKIMGTREIFDDIEAMMGLYDEGRGIDDNPTTTIEDASVTELDSGEHKLPSGLIVIKD